MMKEHEHSCKWPGNCTCDRCGDDSALLSMVVVASGKSEAMCPRCVREVAGEDMGDIMDDMLLEAETACPKCRALIGSTTVH